MTGDNKFFVVLIVMAIVFIGLGVYLFMLDRKLTRIEKKQQEISEKKSNRE